MSIDFPKGFVQKLRDRVISDLKAGGFGSEHINESLVENVIMLIKREGLLLPSPPEPERVLVLSPDELRSLATQAEAFRAIMGAGGSPNMHQIPLQVFGRVLGHLFNTKDQVFVQFEEDGNADWVTIPERLTRHQQHDMPDEEYEE